MNLSKVHEQVRPRGGSSTDESVFEIISVLRRQRWIVALTAALGLAAGILYALKAPEWYQSHAKIMIASKAAGLSGDSSDNEVIRKTSWPTTSTCSAAAGSSTRRCRRTV